MNEPAAWRYKTPHGYVVTKTKTSADSEPLYALANEPRYRLLGGGSIGPWMQRDPQGGWMKAPKDAG